MKNKKAYLQISFSWIFAIIVGAFILFLAIFAVTKIVNTESSSQTLQSSKQIEIFLNPLETSFEESRITSLKLPVESRIYSSCDDIGNFGHQKISVQEKVYGKWTSNDLEISSENKYLFSNPEPGKVFYLFSKPLEIPFKTASLIYLVSSDKEYCFINAPKEIFEELNGKLEHPSLEFEDCSRDSISVCFDLDNSCDINVDISYGEIEYSNSDKIYFNSENLMYAGIFSNKELYECQLKRLVKRADSLAEIYFQKSILNNCDNYPKNLILDLRYSFQGYENSEDLFYISKLSEELNKQNKASSCRLW